jgi:hypothetical protein
MTKEELIDLFLERGGSYDLETGRVFNSKGKECKGLLFKKLNHGRNTNYYRINTTINKKRYTILAHQIIFYKGYGHLPKKGFTIDHINRNGLDNRLSNLRELTYSLNSLNTERTLNANKWYKIHRKYFVKISNRNIGSYDTPEEAEKAYDEDMKIYKNI